MRVSNGFPAFLLLAALVASGCGPQTKMLTSWKAPNFQAGSVKQVLVLGVARDESIRRSYEDRFVTELVKLKLVAKPSYPVLPDPGSVDEAALTKSFRAEGFTHLLATRVVDRKTVETYVPATVTTVGVGGPYGYYGGWGGYYSMGYTTSVSPGYVKSNEVYRLETKMWDLASGEMVWSGLSETWLEGSPQANINAVISKVVYELQAKRIL